MNKKKITVIIIILLIVGILLFVFFFNKKEKTPSKKVSKVKETYNVNEGDDKMKTSNGKTIIKKNGAYYVDDIMIVNKSYPVDQNFEPLNPYKPITSKNISSKDNIDKEVMEAFLKMQSAALLEGYQLFIASGYRSYEYQVNLYNKYKERDGEEAADKYSARAGFSEHQTGLCFDLNGTDYNFLDTPTGKWVEKHATEYGFILRYPKGKEDITGYQYEGWHFRYVGDIAKKFHQGDTWLTLEEYLGVDSKYN